MSKTGLKRSWGVWAIALPLVVQALLVGAGPLRAAITRVVGQTVVLRTAPVDPYDPFQGYYLTLRYDISQRGILSTLEGWNASELALEPGPPTELLRPGSPFFVVLQAPEAAASDSAPQPWQPVAITQQRPRTLAENQIALRGTHRRGRILYGLERYYLPEAKRIALDEQIRQAQTDEAQPRLWVEVRIDRFGNAVPVALWLQDYRIEF